MSKYYQSHNLNEIIIGGSGAGKSFRKIKPDIMQMFGSYVVTDPSGEIYRDTAKFLKKHGYKIKVLNLSDVNYGNSYNPFKYIHDEQGILSLADLFMKNTSEEGEKEDFWVGAARNLLTVCMLYLCKSNETASFGKIMRMISTIRFNNQGRVDPFCDFARQINYHMTVYPNDALSVKWGAISSYPQETMGSVISMLSTRLGLWAVSSVDSLTDEDEMEFESIGKEKTIIYVIIPPARQTYRAVANIFFTQLFEVLINTAILDYKGKLPLLVSCEIDEFANIGQIPNLQETLAVVRKHNVRICIALQGLSQLKALYKDKWESIIGNCSIFTYLGTNDLDTKEYIVKRLGKTTVRVDTKSSNTTGGGTDSENFIGRELLTVDELAKVIYMTNQDSGGNCIVFIDEFDPFYLKKFDTLHHKYFGELEKSSVEADYIIVSQKRMEAYKYKRQKEEADKKDFFKKLDEEQQAKIIAEEQRRIEENKQQMSEFFDDDDFDDDDDDYPVFDDENM